MAYEIDMNDIEDLKIVWPEIVSVLSTLQVIVSLRRWREQLQIVFFNITSLYTLTSTPHFLNLLFARDFIDIAWSGSSDVSLTCPLLGSEAVAGIPATCWSALLLPVGSSIVFDCL